MQRIHLVVLAFGIACHTHETTTASTTAPTASSRAPIGVPRIKGSLTSDATGEAWQNGGVVYLEDAETSSNVATTATMEIRKRAFVPSITVITVGGSVKFVNHEPLTHHIFSTQMEGWDTGYLKENDSATKRFDAVGAFDVLCNIHPEMLGYVVVVPTSFFGIVSPHGDYVIGDVSEGTYKLTAWAPHAKPQTKSVTVEATGVVAVDFAMR